MKYIVIWDRFNDDDTDNDFGELGVFDTEEQAEEAGDEWVEKMRENPKEGCYYSYEKSLTTNFSSARLIS